MSSKKITYTISIILCGLLLTSCGAHKDYSPEEITKLSDNLSSGVTVRVFSYNRLCMIGHIKVRPLINGSIDYNQVFTIRSPTNNYGTIGLTNSAKVTPTIFDPNPKKTALERLNAKDIISAFTKLKPNTYAITEVSCMDENRFTAWVGETEDGFFGKKTAKVIKPVLGANYFELKNNEWLDLGSIELKSVEVSYRNYIAMSVPYSVNDQLKNEISIKFPELTKKISFRTATSLP